MGNLDRAVFLRVSAGVILGAVVAGSLVLWVVPGLKDYRPAVWSTILIPLGCFVGWLLSRSREGVATAALACFALYFLSAFAAARLGTWFSGLEYFSTVVAVQGVAGLGLAVGLAFRGRGLPQVQRLRRARDVSGLAELLSGGTPPERKEAARALGEIGGEEARRALLSALDDPEVEVCREVVGALIGLATPEDVLRLAALLHHPDRRVRRRAWEALRWAADPLLFP